jgi:hypothetical protein
MLGHWRHGFLQLTSSLNILQSVVYSALALAKRFTGSKILDEKASRNYDDE